MINHVRTLLLNQAAPADATAWAEYVPPEFLPLVLPPGLQAVRDALIPKGMQDFGVHSRLAHLLRLVHIPDLEPYVLQFDPRITYKLDEDYFAQLRQPKIEATSFGEATLHYNVRANADWRTCGVAGHQYTWRITVIPETSTVRLAINGGMPVERRITVTNGYTEEFSIIPNYLYGRIQCLTGVLPTKFTSTLNVEFPDVFQLVELLARMEELVLHDGIQQQLMQVRGPNIAAIGELSDLWKQPSDTHLHIGALILLFAHQCECVRLGLATPKTNKVN